MKIKEKHVARFFWSALIIVFIWSCYVLYNRPRYEEIHSPYIDEDGGIMKIERK
jgi:hypothetical protein